MGDSGSGLPTFMSLIVFAAVLGVLLFAAILVATILIVPNL
jgi:hypothetical protein